MKFGSSSSSGGASPWQPPVTYLLVLVIVEIAIMGVLRAYTKHGG
jgi:hypothetical protein